MKRKYFLWTPEATKCFLDVWETNRKSFRGKRRKNLIQKDMSEAMRDIGATRLEIKAKLQVMTKRYRSEVLKFSKTGVYPKWKYFPRVRNIFERDDGDVEEVFEETENAAVVVSNDESSSREFEFPEPASKLFRHDLDTNVEDRDQIHYYYRRATDVEEGKLAIQKETLHVMRSMAKDLSNMYANFREVYKTSLPKRPII